MLLAQAVGEAAKAAEKEWTFFEIYIKGGGPIGYVIILCSIAMVALAIQFFIAIRKGTIMPDVVLAQIQAMFDNRQYREAIDLTATEPSFLSHVVHAALADAGHGYPAMERAMEEAAEEHTTKLLRTVEWMNVLGNVGPMLGLLGTVQGMIGAFFDIVREKGNINPALLATNIGIALVTTLWGLFVAIPALSVYAALRNRIDSLTSEAMVAAASLIATFRPGGKGAMGA